MNVNSALKYVLANKKDLSDGSNKLTKEDFSQLKELDAFAFKEVSALTNYNMKKVIDQIIRELYKNQLHLK